jgi:hypothetical protein
MTWHVIWEQWSGGDYNRTSIARTSPTDRSPLGLEACCNKKGPTQEPAPSHWHPMIYRLAFLLRCLRRIERTTMNATATTTASSTSRITSYQ